MKLLILSVLMISALMIYGTYDQASPVADIYRYATG